MRNISFALTEPQLVAGTKTVTRRLGWAHLKPNTTLRAVDKSMGLRGRSPRVLGFVDVVDVRRERLDAITAADVVAEGFPDLSEDEFVEMFCKHMGCKPDTEVTRIEFRFFEVKRTTSGDPAR